VGIEGDEVVDVEIGTPLTLIVGFALVEVIVVVLLDGVDVLDTDVELDVTVVSEEVADAPGAASALVFAFSLAMVEPSDLSACFCRASASCCS